MVETVDSTLDVGEIGVDDRGPKSVSNELRGSSHGSVKSGKRRDKESRRTMSLETSNSRKSKINKRGVNRCKSTDGADLVSPLPVAKKKVRSKSSASPPPVDLISGSPKRPRSQKRPHRSKSSTAAPDLPPGASPRRPGSQKRVGRNKPSASTSEEDPASPAPGTPRRRGVNRSKSSGVREAKSTRRGVNRSKSSDGSEIVSPSSLRRSKKKDVVQQAAGNDRRSSLKKDYSWWDLGEGAGAANQGLADILGSDSDDEPLPPPPPSFRNTPRSKRFESTEMASSTRSLNPNALKKPATVNYISSIDELYGFGEDNKSGSKHKIPMQIEETPSQPSSYGTLESPSSASSASPLSVPNSTKSLNKRRLKGAANKIASIGELFEEECDSDDSTSSNSTSKQVTWIELPLENPSEVVIKAFDIENEVIESSTVPAGSAILDNLSDIDLQTSLHSIKERILFESGQKTTPSLRETIGRDKRSAQPRASDERTTATNNTGASEQTMKTTNRMPSVGVPETGFQDLNTDDHKSDDNGSSRSRRSVSSLRSIKQNDDGGEEQQNTPSSVGRRMMRRVRRRSMGALSSNDNAAAGNPRRRRSNRRGSLGTSAHNYQTLPSDIETFMTLTDDKNPAATKDAANSSLADKSSHSTLSTATNSTTNDSEPLRRRASAGQLVSALQNLQLTF